METLLIKLTPILDYTFDIDVQRRPALWCWTNVGVEHQCLFEIRSELCCENANRVQNQPSLFSSRNAPVWRSLL